MYATNSLEFRLLLMHNIKQERFAYHSAQWLFGRVMDLIQATGIGTIDSNSAKQYQQSVAPVTEQVLDIINPYKKHKEACELRNREDDAKKLEFVNMLTNEKPNGFASLAELRDSLKKIKQAFTTGKS